jgi:hypothetical protein
MLSSFTVSPPKDDEVIVRVEAAPINPSDLGLLQIPRRIQFIDLDSRIVLVWILKPLIAGIGRFKELPPRGPIAPGRKFRRRLSVGEATDRPDNDD